MTKSATGTVAEPSATGTVAEPKKSSGKRGLNRIITQQSWGIFFEMLLKLTQNLLLKNVLVVVIFQKRIEKVRVNLNVLNVIFNLMQI